jgi:DNA replication protein DnaC
MNNKQEEREAEIQMRLRTFNPRQTVHNYDLLLANANATRDAVADYWLRVTNGLKANRRVLRAVNPITDFDREHAQVVEGLLELSGLPLGQFPLNPILRLTDMQVKSFKDNCHKLSPRNFFYIQGNSGCGKTVMAVGLCQLAISLEKFTYFANTVDLLDDLRPDSEVSQLVMGKCMTYDLLVLDDFGREKFSEWTGERIYRIINHRYDSGLPTVFTSNYYLVPSNEDDATLDELHDFALVRRILDRSVVLNCASE